ncbi:41423_t:CDS:2 [Gigaspora margarita]|uniref:41423_t:CDS:1 n=1 Tax=Gigaspora margarita TaxID=4874 RepID=A0ABN7VRB0_GIGMA|nr:41423_t:CDS:2 [Gigaspora margarita]
MSTSTRKTISLPTINEVEGYKTMEDLINFLRDQDIGLEDKHFNILREQEIKGRNLLRLNVDKIMSYGLKGGPAETIAELIEKIKGEGQDISIEIIKQLIQSPDQLPHKSDLTNFLNENPPVKIPLAPNLFYQISTTGPDGITEEERDTYFILSTEAECTFLFAKLLGQLIYSPSYEKTEDSYHYLWDCIIKNTLELFGMHSASRNRPDMVVLVRNVCPLRGEEKSRDEAGDPSSELVDKIKDWTYGDAPYIFAYYAIEFDLGRLSDRIRIMNFLRNILNLCPPRDSPEFQTIIRPSGAIIELGYAVKKKFADEDRITHLKEIYGVLRANKVRFCDKLEHASTHSVNLAPRGEQ